MDTFSSDRKIIAVFGGGAPQPGSAAYAEAECLGRMLAQTGYTVLNGGYNGTMEAVCRSASEAGGHVIAVTSDVFTRVPVNGWFQDEVRTKDLFDRLRHIIEPADAYVVLRGGMGTLAELTVVWNLAKLGANKPIILVGDAWRSVLERIRNDLYVSTNDMRHLQFVDDPEAVYAALKQAFDEQP